MKNLTTFATALCLASYSAAIKMTSENKSLDDSESDFYAKAGTDCMQCNNDQLEVVQQLNNWNF